MKQQLPSLEIIGTGAVFPGGIGVKALCQLEPGSHGFMETLSMPSKKMPVRQVDLSHPKIARWKAEPRLRRTSQISVFMAEAAEQALDSQHKKEERVGLVCALSTGSIIYSRKFFSGVLSQGRHFASPALFPETVYNSPVSHLAALFGIRGGCYTVVGDETAWVEALRIAQVWIARKTADVVLVIAGEELDALALDAYECAGWFRKGLVASEGAGAVLVRKAAEDSDGSIDISDTSVTFRSKKEQVAAWEKVLLIKKDEPDFMLPGNITPPDIRDQVVSAKGLQTVSSDWGGAFTASTAWGMIQAHDYRRPRHAFQLLVPGSSAAVSSVCFN